ncbi:MAG: hypothetical protein JWN72_2091, partial [Thermoleophilia bacterium]|nr:hypothetical protein [Thermoleophilia bacterium]
MLADVVHLPTWVSLALVIVIVGGGIVLSILSPGAPKGEPPTPLDALVPEAGSEPEAVTSPHAAE